MNKLYLTLMAFAMSAAASAQTWIWYPGDYEIWLGNKMNNRHTERGAFFPPFWKTDTHYPVVEFSTKIDLAADEEVEIASEGKFNIKLDGKLQFGMPSKFRLPAGKHSLNIKVWNQNTPPAIFVSGKTVKSGSDWKVTYEDKEWIDESGKASDTSATVYMSAGCWNFNSAEEKPSEFSLSRKPMDAVQKKSAKDGMLFDFGKETFGYLTLKNVEGNGTVSIYYGESPEEALDTEHCETLDKISYTASEITDLAVNDAAARKSEYTLGNSKAFRYVYVVADNGMKVGDVGMDYEFSKVDYRGSFKCSDDELNNIWNVGAYTMHLTTREFFIDGIKRDRWVWSGDAVQSYLMNYYLFFDSETVKRTTWQLRGKDPVTSHINTIMDYTFYWFVGIYDYYMYTGDKEFVKQIYPRMQSLMEYVMGRINKNGMVEGMTGDWVFVDWADGYLDKKGELSFEQVLFCRSLQTMALCADLAGEKADAEKFSKLAVSLKAKLMPAFWNDEKKALVHNRVNGSQSYAVTRYSNMFSVFFDYFTDEQKQQIKKSVLLNNNILGITTPYMRFYELEALCQLGEHDNVMKEMKSYWGGMLKEGATSFWEKYNPTEKGTQHLEMYGRPYGKSLCHAWGASPIYLLGKYYLGVRPTKPGYEEYVVEPHLGGLKWIEGDVPTPNGCIHVYMDKKVVKVKSGEGKGTIIVKTKNGKKIVSVPAGEEVSVKL
ncbi:MAG: alpha-rhamnosidase [Bacteroidaceae bacterium]|nr:alpha-rhamnosidase [Bacteroidaceae bacterium]